MYDGEGERHALGLVYDFQLENKEMGESGGLAW